MRTLWHVHYLYHIVYQFPIGLRYWKPSPVLRRSHGCRHDKYYRQQDSPDIYTRSHIPYIKSLRNPCGTGSQSRRQTRHTKHPPVVGKYTKSIWTNTITPTFLLRASFGITSWMLRARPLTDTAAPAFAHIITGIRLDGKPRSARIFHIKDCITYTYEHNHID